MISTPPSTDPTAESPAPPKPSDWAATRKPTPSSATNGFDLDKLFTGDWAGAGMVAGAAWAFSLVLSLLLAVIAGVSSHLAVLTGLISGAAFGANVIASAGDGSDQEIHLSLGAYPLTITVAVLALLVTLFWRRLRHRRPGLSEAVQQAFRTAVAFAALNALSGLLLRDTADVGSSLGLIDDEVSLHTYVVGAAFGSFLLSLVTCLGAVVRKREWLPTRAHQARALVGPAAAGLSVMFVVATTLTLIGATIAILAASDNKSSAFTVLIGDLPGVSIYVLLLGIGVGVNVEQGDFGGLLQYSGNLDSVTTSTSTHVTDLADSSAWYWLIVVGALVSIFSGAVATAYFSANLERARRTLLLFVGGFTLAAPLLAHFASIQADGDLGESVTGASFGPSGGAALGLALLLAIVASVLVLALAPRMLPQVAESVSRLQTSFPPRPSSGSHDSAQPAGPVGGAPEDDR